MLDESIQSLVAQINEGAVSPSSVMPSSDSPEPTIESAAPPTPPEETNEQRAYRLAKKHGVDPKLVISMMAQESGGKTKARSWKDARGPMQLMPETAKALGVTDIYDPEQNIEAGVKYLKYGLDKYGRTPDGIKKAIAGYNLGMDKKVLRDPDWWNKISKYSNTEGITGTPMSNPARGLHDRGSTGNYVKNIWSNYMKGGAPTVMNYSISDETVKLAKKLFGTQKPSKAADPVMKDDSAWASGKPVFDPSEQNLGISDETANLAKQLFGGSEYDQYLAQTGQVANPSGQTEYDGLPLIGGRKPTTRAPKTQPVTKEPTLADVNKSLKAEGKKPITQEQLTKQVKENESFGSDVTVGYSGGTPVDDSGDPLPVPIDGPIEVKTDEDILANGTRTIKMDPDTDKDQAFDNALHSIGAEYDLPSSQVEGFIAKRRAAGKTVQYDLTTEERAALKASGKQMGVTVDYGTINDLLNFGRTEPDKIHPKLRQTVDMYTAENRAPKIDLNLPEMNEPKGFINKLRGISPEQERTENMQSDPLYQQAKDNLYREKGFEPNRTLEGSYDLLGAPALDEREIQDEYMRLQSTEKLLDEEAIRRGQERGDTMGASEGGWAGSFSAGLNTSAGLVQVLNQLGGGGAENNVTRYLRRLGKETGAAASVESEKNTGGWDTVNRFITGLPIGLTKAMMLVPTANGSTSIAFGIEAGLGESGRGGTGTDVLRESGKGYLMGTLFPVGRKLGSIAGGGKAGALVDIGTVTAGTAAISGAGGASPEEAGKAGIENAILDVLMRVARMRKSGGKWYDSGEADLDSVKNKIYRYTPNPREIGIVDGGLTRAANIAGVPENHVYFTVKADGSVVVINQPPPKTKVTYIKKAPTQAELESMLRKQVEALGKETTQPSQAGPAMSEPIRSVVPIPGSEPRVVNAEPIPKIVMGGKADPIPESQTAIDAQTAAAADPSQTKRIAVMFPKGTKPQHDPATQWKIVNSKGDVIVVDKEGWKAKAAELGVKPTKSALVEYTKAGKNEVAVQDLLGRPESAVVESTEATPGRAAVEVTQDGTQIDATVVDTEQAAAETVDSMEQQYPDATVEVRDSTEVAENRLADTGLSPVDRFEQQAGRSATSAELGQILEGKTPEEILGLGEITAVADHTPVTFLVPKKVTIGGRDAMEVLMEIPQPGTSAASAVLKAARDGSKTPIDDAIAEMEAGKAKVAGTSFADTVGQYDQAIAGLRKLKNKDIVVDDGPQAGVTRVVRVKANRPPEPTEFTDWANDPNTIDVEAKSVSSEAKVNQEPAKDTLEPESKSTEQPKHRHDEAIAEHKSDIDFNEDQMLAERENIGMIEGDIPEARKNRAAEIAKVRADKSLDKEAKADKIDDIKGKYQDIIDDTESQIEGHKEEISNYKKEIAKSKRKLAKLEAERTKELAEPSGESPEPARNSVVGPDAEYGYVAASDADLAEYQAAVAAKPISEEPHVGMLRAGTEVQLEPYIRPATDVDGAPRLNAAGEPLLEGSLVQTQVKRGTSEYVGDRVLGTDRAEILRELDNRRIEYQKEHGVPDSFIPKSEVPEKAALVEKKVSELVDGDEVMTPDGLGEFISRKGRTVMVEVGGVEKPYLETLVKPTDATEVKVKDTIYNSSGLAGEVVKINDGYVQVQWKDANGKPLGHPVEVKTSNVLVNKPEAKVPADDDLVEMGVGFSFLKKILGLRNRNDSINTLNSLTADAEIAAARETMGKSNGLESSTLLGRMRESAIGVYNGFKRTFININPNKSPEMAVSNDILRQQLAAPAAARGIVTMQIGNITKNLGPQRLQLFTENLLLNDLAKDVEAGKYSNKPLPFGLTPEVLERMLVENEALVAINPEIQDAIVRRQSYVDGITNQLVAYDLLGPEVLSDPRYFHRQVLEYMNEKTYTGTNMSGDLRDRTKGFQRGRTGSSRDYNTNYAEAEFEWLSQAQALILRRQGRDRLQQVNDMKPALDLAARVESTAQGVPVSFREFIPDTHVLWQPKKGNFFYEAFPMAERMLNRLVDGEAELTEINGDYFLEYENNAGDTVSSKVSPRQVLGGRRPEWVIPKNLAAELDNFNAIDTMNPMENVWTSGQNAWKQWTLLNPAKTLVYNLNNMSGDLDITLAYDPSILKYFPGAAKDSWNFSVRGRDGGQDIESALKLGVIDSGLTVAEIPDIQTQTAFKGLSNNDSAGLMKAVGTFWDTTKNLTNGRENILRLAAFRYFKDKLAAGENVYGASNPEQINAIRRELGDEAAAAKLSRELVGDYGAVSVSGRWIRRHMIPFYSWIEINAPRYVKMLKNTTKEDGAQAGYGRYARATGVGAVKTALNVTKFAAKAGLFAAAASMYNRTAFPDEDKELRRQGDRNYIILGRRADGSIRSLKLAGALKDMLEWGGLEDLPRDIDEMIAGDRTIKDELIEVPKAAVNKLVQSLEPVTKTMYELIMGEQVYPTIFPPKSEMGLVSRPIRDRAAHIARTLSSKALYDAGYYVYAKLTGRPEMPTRPWTAGDTLGKVLDATIAYRMDPNETMFWSIKGDSIDWAKKNGKEMPAMDPTEKSNALFYYKQGLKIGDQKAAEQWRQEYLNLGGTEEGLKSSIDKAHPLASLSSDKEKLEYVKQLTPEKKQQLKQALAYYHGIYLLGGEGDDKTSEELFAKMMIQIEGGELSSRRKEEEKASLESRVAAALESRKMGNDTLFNQLPTAERNKVLLKENTSDEIEDFSRADATEKLYVFKNSPVEDQASMAAFIRKLSGQLYKQSLPAKRKGQSKKPLSREDQVLLKEMQEALKQYEGLKKGLPADVVKKLKEAELTSTKALPPVKPKARKKHY